MRMKFATKPYDIIHLTLGMLLHYLGKLKTQIFCRYSTDIEENANKLHFSKELAESSKVGTFFETQCSCAPVWKFSSAPLAAASHHAEF